MNNVDSLAILIDFGSTFTKVTAVDLSNAQVLGRSQAPSTVLTDVREGLLQGLQSLHERHSVFRTVPKDLSVLDGHVVLASSSAAGGLRIVVVGNVPGLTVEAANQAALDIPSAAEKPHRKILFHRDWSRILQAAQMAPRFSCHYATSKNQLAFPGA